MKSKELKSGQKISKRKLKRLGWKSSFLRPANDEIIFSKGRQGIRYDFKKKEIVRIFK